MSTHRCLVALAGVLLGTCARAVERQVDVDAAGSLEEPYVPRALCNQSDDASTSISSAADLPLQLQRYSLGAIPLGSADSAAVALARDLLRTEGIVIIDRGSNFSSPADVRGWSEVLVSAVSGERDVYTREGAFQRAALGHGVYSTGTETARGGVHIPEHNEMSYWDEYPSHVLLACFACPRAKGQSTLIDNAEFTRALEGTELHRKLGSHGVTHQRLLFSETGRAPHTTYERSWQGVFGVGSAHELEAVAAKRSMRVDWLGHGRARLSLTVPAFEETADGGRVLFFGISNHASFYNTTPGLRELPYEQRPSHLLFGDGSEWEDAEVSQVYAALEAHRILLPWVPGRLVTVDNVRWLHGRVAYALQDEGAESRRIGFRPGPGVKRRLLTTQSE